jgi:hypothetical protein
MANSRDPYRSEGKSYNRNTWARESAKLARTVNRPLTAMWLSSDEFIDLQDIFPLFREIWVPEIDPKHLKNKHEFLRNAPADFAAVVRVPSRPTDMLDMVHEMAGRGWQFDILNLDFCVHLTAHTMDIVSAILRSRLIRPNGLLFLTVARVTKANMTSHLRNKVLATTIDGVNEQLAAEFNKDHVKVTALPDYPYLYNGRDSARSQMFSFGWRLAGYHADKGRPKKGNNLLSVREKHAIVYLRLAKISAPLISAAFGVSPGTISALLAWFTMRARKEVGAVAAQPTGKTRWIDYPVHKARPEAAKGNDLLSEREKQIILCLRLAGISADVISEAFAVSHRTIAAQLADFAKAAGKDSPAGSSKTPVKAR